MNLKSLLYTFLCLAALTLQAQKVEKIEFSGNKRTKLKVLKKITRLKEGQVLDSIVLQNDAILLSRLPAFSKATYKVKKEKNGNYSIVFNLEETNTLIPTINFWTTTNQQFTYQLGVKEFNFLGENKEIGGFYRNNGFHSFAINYTDPFLFDSYTGAKIRVQNLTSLEPLYFDGGSANYRYRNSSVEFSAFKRFTFAHTLELGINIFEEKYTYQDGFRPPEAPENFEQTKLLFKAGFDYNRLKFEYQYVNGYRNLLLTQYVMPIEEGQEEFAIALNESYYYKKVAKRGNFASRLRIGLASNNDNPFAPFALDNNLNIRGVGDIIDRGTAVVVLNAEYRHTLIDKKWFALQTNLFVDAGNWRTAGGSLSQLFESDNARLHPGGGLRFIHKKIFNAVFRIDYGWSVLSGKKEKGLVFGIGQYF